MKTYLYAVCPHCEHPNIHVEDGALKSHTIHIGSNIPCIGSELNPLETHASPLNRNTLEFQEALRKARIAFKEPEDIKPSFHTWEFSGLQFIAVPIDRGSVHIADLHGNNYGSWMSVDEFRKRQKAGRIEDWKALGKCHLNIVCDR